MKMKRILSLLLAAAMLLGLTAGGAAASEDGLKVISYANGGEPEVLEPIMSNYAATSILVYNIFTGLCRVGADGNTEMGYAESYELSEDGMTYTFKLRADSKFSDGSPLTAHDFEQSIKHKLDPETASPGVYFHRFVKNGAAFNEGTATADEVGVKALDDYTLEIQMENYTPYFLDIACTYIPYKMDVVLADSGWHKNPETYIGNGAFRVKEINPQVNFVLEKNPYYYDAENVKIDQVNFNFIADQSVELEAYRNGELNVSDNLNAEAIASYRDNAEEYNSANKIGTGYYSIHTINVPDKLVRQALSMALHREIIINDILGYTYKPAEGIVPYGIHWGDKEYREVAGSFISEDVAKAQELLAEAGYPGGEGFPTLRLITQNSQAMLDVAQAMQAMWKSNLGIDCEITALERSVYWDEFDTDTWDIAMDGYTGDFDDPYTLMYLWMAYREGPDKDVRWFDTEASIEYDRLLNLTLSERDYETRMGYFRDAEAVITEDMPVIPMYHYDDPILVKPEVQGVVKSYIGHVFFQFADIVE